MNAEILQRAKDIESRLLEIEDDLRKLGGPSECPHGSHVWRVELGLHQQHAPPPKLVRGIPDHVRNQCDEIVVNFLKAEHEKLTTELDAL